MKRYKNVRSLLVIAFIVFLMPGCSKAGNLECNHLPVIMEDFLSHHYAMKTLDDVIESNTIDQMIKRLDPTRTLLYESDVAKLQQELRGMFDTMRKGNCAALNGVYDLLLARAKENEKYVKQFLGPGYQLDKEAELNTDVKKRPYPKTRAEKEELLRKFVHFQIANNLLADHNLAEAKKQQIHRYELQTKRIAERDPEKLITSFAEAFALSLDPHSTYLSPDNLEEFRIQMQLSLEGIGAILSSENGFTIIEELIPGGGAERMGVLKPKDKIIAVAQEGERPVNVIDMELRDVIKMIRGKKGTKVTLTILRRAERTNRFTVTIVRDRIDIKESEAKLTYQKRRIGPREYLFGVITLPSFYGGEKGKSSYRDVKTLVMQAKTRKVNGIVLDLSRNGGGLLNDAVRIAGLFLDKGGVVATKNADGRITILANGIPARQSRDGKLRILTLGREIQSAVYNGPLVVVTSRVSASASEIVAGALKDYHRAVIAGADHTFGKGSVQRVDQLPYGLGGMKVTTEMFFLPGGMSTQKSGVAADIVLPGLFNREEIGESALDYPLPPQKIDSFVYLPGRPAGTTPPWRPVTPALVTALAAKSKARIAKDKDFAEIVKTGEEIAEKRGIVRVADLLKENEKDHAAKTDWQELRRKAKEREATYVNEGINILCDMIAGATTSQESGSFFPAKKRLR